MKHLVLSRNVKHIPASSGVPRGDAQDARASPLPPPVHPPPPGHVHPPLSSLKGWL